MARIASFYLILALSLCDLNAQIVSVENGSYFSSFDLALQCTRQVEYVLHAHDIGEAKRKASWRFTNDIFHPDALAIHDDYTRSGYQRGHLCPAADRSTSLLRMKKTFRISNIAPQTKKLNTGTWKGTENLVRKWAKLIGDVRVIVVPLWLHQDTTFIGIHHVAVPHAFVKIAIVEETDSVLATWFYWNR